jgi:hypothetical protein
MQYVIISFKFEISCAGGTSYKFGKLPTAGSSERKQSKWQTEFNHVFIFHFFTSTIY